MNLLPAELEGDTVKLPMVDVTLPTSQASLRDRLLEHGDRRHPPEHFEDASLVSDELAVADLQAAIDVVEWMGAELYAYFSVASDATIESQELRDSPRTRAAVRSRWRARRAHRRAARSRQQGERRAGGRALR